MTPIRPKTTMWSSLSFRYSAVPLRAALLVSLLWMPACDPDGDDGPAADAGRGTRRDGGSETPGWEGEGEGVGGGRGGGRGAGGGAGGSTSGGGSNRPTPGKDAGTPSNGGGGNAPVDPVNPGGGCNSGDQLYSTLPNGSGGTNLEQVSYACVPSFDMKASLAAFKTTLYPLLTANCGSCHSTESDSQAPILADPDPELAHAYALTRVNFRHPEDAKVVLHVQLIKHHCFGSCSDSASKLLAAVKAWAAAIHVPEAPRGVPEGTKISEDELTQWIATDRAKLAAADSPYMVYASAHEMHNAGLSADRLNVGRVALSKILNATARWAPKLVNPVDINGKGMVYRFDIRDYWGYNKGVKSLIFGGSDDDIFFGDKKNLLSFRFNYARTVSVDPAFAKTVWARVREGSKEAPGQKGAAANNKGFKADYVELGQLVYTLSRPDVYNAIMALPIYADELEDELGVDRTDKEKSYQYVAVDHGITIAPRIQFRAKLRDGGFYWKAFDLFTGSGQVYPFWEHPLPKFVTVSGGSDAKYSLLATLAQPSSGSEPAGCDSKTSFGGFATCTHYTGTGGVQQHASETIWSLPNGLHGYAIYGGLNQRRTDAFTFIVVDPRRLRSAANNGGSSRSELRLNNAGSCFGCHEEGMKRENNDLRDRLDTGALDVAWKSDSSIVSQVEQLYPPSSTLRPQVEEDHRDYLKTMSMIRAGMILGEDKNVLVEPIVWTFEWTQAHYRYADTLAN